MIIPTYLLINKRKTSHKAGTSAVSYIALERELRKRKREREEKKEVLQHKIFVFGRSFKLETRPEQGLTLLSARYAVLSFWCNDSSMVTFFFNF